MTQPIAIVSWFTHLVPTIRSKNLTIGIWPPSSLSIAERISNSTIPRIPPLGSLVNIIVAQIAFPRVTYPSKHSILPPARGGIIVIGQSCLCQSVSCSCKGQFIISNVIFSQFKPKDCIHAMQRIWPQRSGYSGCSLRQHRRMALKLLRAVKAFVEMTYYPKMIYFSDFRPPPCIRFSITVRGLLLGCALEA
jgi:hypothetical protein